MVSYCFLLKISKFFSLFFGLEVKILQNEQFETYNELLKAKNEIFKKNLILILQLLGKKLFELLFKRNFY